MTVVFRLDFPCLLALRLANAYPVQELNGCGRKEAEPGRWRQLLAVAVLFSGETGRLLHRDGLSVTSVLQLQQGI